jgi:citrate lyase synthetase
MKLETQDIINVFRVTKNKKMIVYNKRNKIIREGLMDESG